MKLYMLKTGILTTAALWLLIGLATPIAARQQPLPAQQQKMVELHKKMAEMHAKMAACIESDKDLNLCRQEMNETCKADFGDHCPMMGRGHMGGRGGLKNMTGTGYGMMNGSCTNWMTTPED